jgi:hypothetical protein
MVACSAKHNAGKASTINPDTIYMKFLMVFPCEKYKISFQP